MKRTATPLHPFFVANITDIDVGKPIDKDIKQAIERAGRVRGVRATRAARGGRAAGRLFAALRAA
jgi:hypothetical protein